MQFEGLPAVKLLATQSGVGSWSKTHTGKDRDAYRPTNISGAALVTTTKENYCPRWVAIITIPPEHKCNKINKSLNKMLK